MSKKHVRISIVIPAYNEEHHVSACLQAIARQTTRPYEVIVVNNNSTDQTGAVAKQFPFVKVVEEKHQGIVFARNAGFDAARGDIIARIDADSLVPPNWLEKITEFYENPPNLTSVWTGRAYFYNTRFPTLLNTIFTITTFRLNKLLLGHYPTCGSNMALSRNQWHQVRTSIHNQTDIHEDIDLAIHLHEAGFQIYYDPSARNLALLRRVYSQGDQLWNHLQCWPRTLRLHNKSWRFSWLWAAIFYFFLRPVLIISDWISRLMGRKPLTQ